MTIPLIKAGHGVHRLMNVLYIVAEVSQLLKDTKGKRVVEPEEYFPDHKTRCCSYKILKS